MWYDWNGSNGVSECISFHFNLLFSSYDYIWLRCDTGCRVSTWLAGSVDTLVDCPERIANTVHKMHLNVHSFFSALHKKYCAHQTHTQPNSYSESFSLSLCHRLMIWMNLNLKQKARRQLAHMHSERAVKMENTWTREAEAGSTHTYSLRRYLFIKLVCHCFCIKCTYNFHVKWIHHSSLCSLETDALRAWGVSLKMR